MKLYGELVSQTLEFLEKLNVFGTIFFDLGYHDHTFKKALGTLNTPNIGRGSWKRIQWKAGL